MTTPETCAFIGLVFFTGFALGAGLVFVLKKGRAHDA